MFPDAVGLSEDGRENLMPYGTMVFNSFGPRNDLFDKAMANAGPVRDWIMSKCSRAALAPDGLGIQIFHAVDAGELSEAEAGMLVRSFLSAGIDTTVYGLGNALYCFASYPEQWTNSSRKPESDPRRRSRRCCASRLRCRLFSVPQRGRLTSAAWRSAKGRKCCCFWPRPIATRAAGTTPDTFDVRRRAAGHMTFGTGIHGCVGQAVARLESEAMFGALARRVASFELTGKPERRLNNTLRGLDTLPLRIVPA